MKTHIPKTRPCQAASPFYASYTRSIRRKLAARHKPSRNKLFQYRRYFGDIQLPYVVDVAVSPRVRLTQRRRHQRSAELVGVEQIWSTGTRRVHWTWLGHRFTAAADGLTDRRRLLRQAAKAGLCGWRRRLGLRRGRASGTSHGR